MAESLCGRCKGPVPTVDNVAGTYWGAITTTETATRTFRMFGVSYGARPNEILKSSETIYLCADCDAALIKFIAGRLVEPLTPKGATK